MTLCRPIGWLWESENQDYGLKQSRRQILDRLCQSSLPSASLLLAAQVPISSLRTAATLMRLSMASATMAYYAAGAQGVGISRYASLNDLSLLAYQFKFSLIDWNDTMVRDQKVYHYEAQRVSIHLRGHIFLVQQAVPALLLHPRRISIGTNKKSNWKLFTYILAVWD